ncbi:MAG TPA: hypothetical protein VIF43_02425 [Patescibacteria group bacterium]|jgi:hypothetical protein
MKAGGARVLWLATAGLALLFLAVWAADGDDRVIPPQQPRSQAEATPDQSAAQQEKFKDLALSDAASRVDSRARIGVESTTVGTFKGPDLQSTGPGDPAGTLGTVLVLSATVDGRPVSKLTYHAAPPDTVVFVKQEAP